MPYFRPSLTQKEWVSCYPFLNAKINQVDESNFGVVNHQPFLRHNPAVIFSNYLDRGATLLLQVILPIFYFQADLSRERLNTPLPGRFLVMLSLKNKSKKD